MVSTNLHVTRIKISGLSLNIYFWRSSYFWTPPCICIRQPFASTLGCLWLSTDRESCLESEISTFVHCEFVFTTSLQLQQILAKIRYQVYNCPKYGSNEFTLTKLTCPKHSFWFMSYHSSSWKKALQDSYRTSSALLTDMSCNKSSVFVLISE